MRILPTGLAVLMAIGFTGCPPPDKTYDASDFAGALALVVEPETQAGGAVRVDVALDATTSMEGYAQPGSVYGRFLEGVESSLSSRWQEADVRFFRFGTRVDSIGRAEFRAARADPSFYRVPGVFEKTNIDSVLARTAPGRVTLVVTDLFQTDDDKNALVEQIKRRAFGRGLAVGMVAVESEFKGRVYDAPGGAYAYASTSGDASTNRPFYAIAIGEAPVLRRLFETIRSVPGVAAERMLLITAKPTRQFEVTLEKPRETRAWNLTPPSPGSDEAYRLNAVPDKEGTTLNGHLAYTLLPGTAPIDPSRVVLRAYRADVGPDSTASTEFRLANLRADGAGAIAFDIETAVTQPAGKYRYLLVFEANDLDGQATPEWVMALSSANPTAAADANRTLNLDRFVADLVQASATMHAPHLGALVLDVVAK